jgi:outer membrane receptor protein involved in Fe transport
MLNLRSSPLWKLLLLLSVFLAFGLVVNAQEAGIIAGVVEDPSGAVIPNATVTVTNQGTNVSTTLVTGSAGRYRAEPLIPGLYSVKVEAKGFRTLVQREVQVTVGSTIRVDAKMELGQEIQTITVEATAPLVSTEEGRLSSIVTGQQIANLGLNGRNVFDLIQLAPGAVNVSGVMFEAGAGVVVNGVRENFNGFIMDGVSNKGLSGGFITQPNADTVQEFQVNTLNMSAQYGNSAGAVTNLVTKSGTNAFHGTAYEYVRNDVFDATDFFTNKGRGECLPSATTPEELATCPSKSPLRFNQFGVTAGGPIRKDKTFFFASFQGDRTITSAAPVPVVVESAAWRNAVVGALPNSVAALLYRDFPAPSGPTLSTVDGFVGDTYGDFGTLVCPDNFSSGIATSFQTLFGVTAAEAAGCATPITVGQSATQLANRTLPFQQSTVAIFGTQAIGNLFNGNQWSARVDHNLSDKDRIFGKFYYQHTADRYGPSNTSNLRGFKNPTSNDFPNFSLSWSHIFSPTVINELKVGYARNSTNIGVPPEQAGVPSIGFGSGEIGFGAYNGYPQFFHENIYSYSDMVAINKGKHAIKIGADIRRNIENSEFNVARPSYYFFDQLFLAADAPAEQVAGVDPGILSGTPAELATNNRAWRNVEFGFFVQDDWKVTRNLTLNLGLRYDLYKRHTEKFGRVTDFILGSGDNITERVRSANTPAGDPGCDTPEQILQAQIAGVCGPGGFAAVKSLGSADHNNFGPRLGFAWDPFGSGKTALRGGFGVAYEGTLYNPLSNSRWNLPYYSFNIADNFLFGDVSNTIYGPTTRDGSGNLIPSGEAPSYTGAPTNPGQGVGAQAVGNLTGWDYTNSNLAYYTAIVDPGGLRDPYIYSYFLGVQRELTSTLGIEVNYVGSAGHKLFRAAQVNANRGGRLPIWGSCQDTYISGGDTTVCSNMSAVNGVGRTNPNYGTLRFWENSVNSNYHSLQFSLTQKMKHGLAFNLNYTWGHSIDGGSDWHSGATSANGAAAGDAYNLDVSQPGLDRGHSTFDFRHRLVFNYVWELPWMKSQQGVAGHILGGWQLNGIWSFQTGAHWTAYDSRARTLRCFIGGVNSYSANSNGGATACFADGGTIADTGGDYNLDTVANDRPDVAGANTIAANNDQYANGYFYNNSNGTSGIDSGFFSTPCLGCNGSLARNTFVGPGMFVADLSVLKNIKLSEQVSLQFRSEFFNAFNRTNFYPPSSSTGANYANRIQNPIFGASAGTFDPREIQFALKLIW